MAMRQASLGSESVQTDDNDAGAGESVLFGGGGGKQQSGSPVKPGLSGASGDGTVFHCDYADCDKTFSRKDHLIRHQANHSTASYICHICSRPFKRLDLLQRHEKRNICTETPVRATPLDDASTAGPSVPTSYAQPNKRRRSSPPPPASPPHLTSLQPIPGPSFPPHQHLVQPPSNMYNPAVLSALQQSIPLPAPLPVSAPAPAPGDNPYPLPLPIDNLFADPSMNIFAEWGLDFFPDDPWLPKQNEHLAGPFNEPVQSFDFDLWNDVGLMDNLPELMADTRQISEPVEPLASAALLGRVQLAFPTFDMSLVQLSEAIALYWSHVAPSFPFIHRGTFDLESSPSELVAIMAIIGSMHQRSSTSPLASSTTVTTPVPLTNSSPWTPLVAQIRGQLVQQLGSEAPISMMQTFCLCHIHDTWYGDEDTLFLAQCTWPLIVAHSRKKGIGVVGAHSGQGGEDVWQSWAKGEERRRASYCILMLDTETSAFWNQHPGRQLSVFAHDLPLPCSKLEWEALTPYDWIRVHEPAMGTNGGNGNGNGNGAVQSSTNAKRDRSRSAYLPGLHPEFTVTQVPEGFSSAILSAMVSQADIQFQADLNNSLSVQMVLLGLMGTAWDHRIKGGMGITFKAGAKHWRKLTLDALIHLREVWERSIQQQPACPEIRDIRDTFGIGILSVLSDIPMLQAMAGATIICGSSIGPKHYADARRRCKIWIKTDDGWTCLWQSARYLKTTLFTEWGVYTPWASFLATIVFYCFSSFRPPIEAFPPPSSNHARGADRLLDRVLSSPDRVDLGEGMVDLITFVRDKLAGCVHVNRGHAALLTQLLGSIRGSVAARGGASGGGGVDVGRLNGVGVGGGVNLPSTAAALGMSLGGDVKMSR